MRWREIHQQSAGTQRFHYSVSSGLPMKHSLLNGFVSSRFQCYISLSLSPSPSFRLYMNVPSYTPKAKMKPPTIVFPISSMVLQCLPTFTTRMAQMLAKLNSTTELLSKEVLYGFAQNWEKLAFLAQLTGNVSSNPLRLCTSAASFSLPISRCLDPPST